MNNDDTILIHEDSKESLDIQAVLQRTRHLSMDQQAYLLRIMSDLTQVMSREEPVITIS